MRQGRNKGRYGGELKGVRTTLLKHAPSNFDYIPAGFTQKINAFANMATLNA
jgi:hypothetical protein